MSNWIIIKTKRTTNYVYLNDKGSDTPMVFLHGFAGSHYSWDEVVEKLGCTVVTLDLPGHGKSTFNNLDADYSVDDWCEDFNEILNSLYACPQYERFYTRSYPLVYDTSIHAG